MTTIVIPEHRIPGRRLGRHIEHDPRSKDFAFTATPKGALRSIAWPRHAPIFNQGDLGKCTCEALVGCAMTGPLFRKGHEYGDADATKLYEHATRLDRVAGHWPPDDTGSTGLAAAKAGKAAGMIGGYRHAFSIAAALEALQHGPIMVGMPWYESFDRPVGLYAELVIAGGVRGGHEMAASEIDVERKLVRFAQSWGADFGDHGWVTIGFDTLARLLDEQGDVTIPLAVAP